MKPFSIKWFVLAFESTPEKPHRKVSGIRPQQAMGAPAAAGEQRPGETAGCQHAKMACSKKWQFRVFPFSRSRMPTIWKSLLALLLAAATCIANDCQRFKMPCFWNMPTIWKKGRYVRYVNAKDAKDAWSSEMRAMSPHMWMHMLMHASFWLYFKTSLQVIPSQCQAFMASVARD